MSHILIVDDEPSICWGFQQLLGEHGHNVSVSATAEEALEFVTESPVDLVVMDVRLPGQSGLSAIPRLRQRIGDAVPVVVITAFGNLETAVEAVRVGAFDYVTKPFDLDHVLEVVQRALTETGSRAGRESGLLKSEQGLLGQAPAMQRVFRDIALAAPSDVPVLITGESGTGKEEVALAIHRFSPRFRKPFVPVFLGALSAGLVESELFGHVRGAFTGAANARPGLLALADGGTAFLDEVGDIPLAAQVKLLRAIERREITPVGDAAPVSVDFRVIAATHRPLGRMVAAGEFRDDLYYRLGVYHIEVPPLRERREDIPLLARRFLHALSAPYSQTDFSNDALDELASRSWRGNVRELRNTVERSAVVARGELIRPVHLPAATLGFEAPSATPIGERVAREIREWAERELSAADVTSNPNLELYEKFLRVAEPPLLQAVLERTNQQRSLAANLLGIHRSTLRQKLSQIDDISGEDTPRQ